MKFILCMYRNSHFSELTMDKVRNTEKRLLVSHLLEISRKKDPSLHSPLLIQGKNHFAKVWGQPVEFLKLKSKKI